MTNFCCGCTSDWFDRRRLLQMTGVAVLGAALPAAAQGVAKTYEAMLLSCIDPRMVAPVYRYMNGRGLTGHYSQFVIAGAGAALVADKFEAWRPAFWGNLAASVELHHISRVIVIDHRDCGAVRLAYGAESIATPAAETATHRKILAEFRDELHRRHPNLVAETGLMALDGSLESLA